MDNRDPIAVFGVEATNAILAAVERVDPHARVQALKAELDEIDPKLFLALNARTNKMLHLENGLTDMAAAREALKPIFANYLKNTFIKLCNGDQTALEGLCGACSGGNSAVGSFLDDISGAIGGAIGAGANAVKGLACKIAPMASSVPDPRVAGGAAIANSILCGSGSGGGMSQEQILAIMAAQEAQRRAEQQRTMLLIGGGLAAVLLVVALK